MALHLLEVLLDAHDCALGLPVHEYVRPDGDPFPPVALLWHGMEELGYFPPVLGAPVTMEGFIEDCAAFIPWSTGWYNRPDGWTFEEIALSNLLSAILCRNPYKGRGRLDDAFTHVSVLKSMPNGRAF